MENRFISCFGPCPTAQLQLSSAPSLMSPPGLGTPQELILLPWSESGAHRKATLEEEHTDSPN